MAANESSNGSTARLTNLEITAQRLERRLDDMEGKLSVKLDALAATVGDMRVDLADQYRIYVARDDCHKLHHGLAEAVQSKAAASVVSELAESTAARIKLIWCFVAGIGMTVLGLVGIKVEFWRSLP